MVVGLFKLTFLKVIYIWKACVELLGTLKEENRGWGCWQGHPEAMRGHPVGHCPKTGLYLGLFSCPHDC